MNRYFLIAFVATFIALFACCVDNDKSLTAFGGSYATSNEQLAGPLAAQIRSLESATSFGASTIVVNRGIRRGIGDFRMPLELRDHVDGQSEQYA